MSYDIDVGTQDFNYTSNMHKFFKDFGVHPLDDLHGKTPQEAAFWIAAALLRMSHWDYTELCEQYDSQNGWGSVDTAMKFLFDVYVACLTETDVDTVSCSA